MTDVQNGFSALPYTVLRVIAGHPTDHGKIEFGTGFFYNRPYEDSDLPLIVSNKHVLVGKPWLEFDFAKVDNNGRRIFGPPYKARIEAGALPIFEHPDKNVDLAAIPIAPIIERARNDGVNLHVLHLEKKNIIPDYLANQLSAASPSLMVGFPNGLMDEINNISITRRGSLATPYSVDYMGRKNFVVDIAAFGGSSGSPVFALYDNLMPLENGGIGFMGGQRFFFIGVLHSGPVLMADGTFVPMPVPTSTGVVQTKLTYHLGYCAKALQVEEIPMPA